MTAVTLYDTTILCDELGCKRRFREPVTSRVRDLCPDHTRTGETDG